jgi:hypothetical protein
MPLTRHFYALDEVHAALHYASNRNDRLETLFWCKELLLSQCGGETISTLFEAWLWNKGPFQLQWLLGAWATLAGEELSEDDILLAAYQLSAISYRYRDHSLWNILVLTAQGAAPERLTPKTPAMLPSSDDRECYIVRALFQGKAYSAWWMSQQIAIDRVWELLVWYATHCTKHAVSYHTCLKALQNYEQLLGYRTKEYDTIIRCLAVLSLCLSPSQQEHSLSSLPLVIDAISQDRLAEWSQLIGRKSYRIYSIPKNCLYGTTGRGRMSWHLTSVPQLNETHLIGCPFWEDALSEYALIDDTIHWNSNDAMEQFYDRYFPDDLPDEWTKAEKERSHGDGLLDPRDTVNLAKYARLFLSQCARLAWNSRPIVRAFLEQHRITECHPSTIVSLFPPIMYTNIDWKTPLRRCRVLSFPILSRRL